MTIPLPAGMSAAGSWWEVQGVAGLEKHDHRDIEVEYDCLKKKQGRKEA